MNLFMVWLMKPCDFHYCWSAVGVCAHLEDIFFLGGGGIIKELCLGHRTGKDCSRHRKSLCVCHSDTHTTPYTHLYTHTHPSTPTHTHTHTHTHLHLQLHTHTHTHAHIHTYIH